MVDLEQTEVLAPDVILACPHCAGSTRLQFDLHSQSIWAQCLCGYGWDLPITPEKVN